jgi:hypothetical protein
VARFAVLIAITAVGAILAPGLGFPIVSGVVFGAVIGAIVASMAFPGRRP